MRVQEYRVEMGAAAVVVVDCWLPKPNKEATEGADGAGAAAAGTTAPAGTVSGGRLLVVRAMGRSFPEVVLR